jgi:CspA family cold shock protein
MPMSLPDRRGSGNFPDNSNDGDRAHRSSLSMGDAHDDGASVRGTVKWFNPDKGFGFVTLADGADCFLHASALARAGVSVTEGDAVLMRVGQSPRGRQVTEVLEVQPGQGPQRRPAPAAGGGRARPGSRPGNSGPAVEARGTVKWWNAAKGFGFITPADGTKDVFVHVSTLTRCGIQSLPEGAAVAIRVTQGPKGPEAVEVTLGVQDS